MKRNFTLATKLILLLSLPFGVFGQQDYKIRLHSGEFLLESNIDNAQQVLTNSFFDGRSYVTIQFNALPTDAQKVSMSAAGINLIDYIPNFAYTASVKANTPVNVFRQFNVRSIFQFSPADKTIPEVLNRQVPSYATKILGYTDVTITTYEILSASKIIASLNELDAGILEEMPHFRNFTVRIATENLGQLVALPFVQWVEFVQAPNQLENLPGRTLHRVSVVSDGARNLKGDGINVGIWDEGEISQHLDFLPTGRVTQVEFSSPSQHSTHCAGTILGRGLINPTARGMAPNASLYSYNFSGNVLNEMATAIPANNLIISSHSYNDGGSVTCALTGTQIQYTTVSRNTDLNLNNFPNHLHVHSSGNAGASCSNQYMTITGTGKSAKNNVVVGNITSLEVLSGSSSCGPVADGRVKPELVAMGTSVFSTNNTISTYATLSGTSMSTPGIAGSLALLVQRYKQLNGNTLPPSTLIKNIACNGAHDLGNPGPDYRFGFGRINVLNAVKILEENRFVIGPGLSTGNQNNTTITVPAGAARLKVMLTWNDPAAAANSNPAIVNNLDLTVINGATTTLPWILDKNTPSALATQAVDNVSNIEQVTIDNPPAGSYTLRVTATSVPTGPQTFALSWIIDQPYIEVNYPNGPESFAPGTAEILTWDNAGVTGVQTVEYSIDNGNNWTVINSGVPAATTRLSWTPPAGTNTSQARIRVTAGSITDMSDGPFKIIGNSPLSVGPPACSAGEVNLTWTAVTNATHYDIYRLDAPTGAHVLIGSDITATSYTATGLTPGSQVWFSLISKNNTTGSASPRSNAISATVSSGGGGLGAIGSISGQSTVCGATNGVTYSISAVSGATGYAWSVPPGATIQSGQNTTSIVVNYSAGASNGNVSVVASNGTCSSSPATLAIAVNGSGITSPLSGGNQSAVSCPPTSTPVLTATATVPAGHTIIWYTAATGGSVVSNPTLSTVGTVTYYAASVHTASGCESSTRTAVTLTITAANPASITAAGPLTFCEGGSVQLTANSGSSYLWSTGATTQSINVTTSGTFTVTVTNGGCSNTSPVTTVTVNPNPTASITAGGPLTFCQGDNVVLTASAGSSWSWSNGATTQAITVNSSGSYTVTVTHASGCSNTSVATTVAVSQSPVVTISASPYNSLFPGLVTTLTANVTPPGNYSYAWFKNGNLLNGVNSATISNVSIADIGSYTVTVTNTTGLPCSNTSSAFELRDSAFKKLFIFPSPNAGEFKVAYYTPGSNVKNTLNVYDSKGALVWSRVFTLNSPYQTMDVDLRRFSRGIYQVALFDNTGKQLANGKVLTQ